MKLSVLESIISGEYCKCGEYVFPKYKVRRGSFDWSDPFNITTIDICGAARRAPWDFNAVKNFSFSSRPLLCVKEEYKTQQNERLCEQINREMKLVFEQVECFLKEYDDSEKLEWMCMDIVESLVCYALDAYENIHALGYFIGVTAIEFSFAYREFLGLSFDTWCEMKFSFLFNEDEDLRDIYVDLVNKGLPKKEEKEEEKLQIMDEDDMVAEAHRMLAFLNCEYEGYRFVTEVDYVKLVEWIDLLIREKRIADDVHKIELQKRMTEKGMKQWDKHFLSYTIRKIHNVCFKNTNVRWKTFLSMITGWKESSITAHFSKCPDDYDEIVAKCVGSSC